MELLESQKPSFSIFLVLKGLNKIKEIKNYSESPKLLSQSLFKQFRIENLTLSLPATRCAGHNTDLPSNRNISKTVRITIAFTQKFFKEYCISSNKCLLNFETEVRRLSEGGAHFKVKEMNNIKYQNLAIFFFQNKNES